MTVLVTLTALLASGCSAKSTISEFAATCAGRVAEWASVSANDVSWVDVSDENALSGANRSWDIAGQYPGGEWRCGAPASSSEPSQLMVYPGGQGAYFDGRSDQPPLDIAH